MDAQREDNQRTDNLPAGLPGRVPLRPRRTRFHPVVGINNG